MKPVILLDCDGPLSNFTKAYLKVVTAETGFPCRVENVDRWAIHTTEVFRLAAEFKGITVQELKSKVEKHIVRQSFCTDIEVQKEAQAAVEELRSIGEVFVVTSPWDSSPTWMYERLHWCNHHFGISRGNVIQAGTKHLIRGDVFVDDKVSHVRDWQEAWPKGVGVLFSMHHNHLEDSKGIQRGGWELTLEAAKKAAQGKTL